MITKCICINCEFYLSCWIAKSLENFPKNYRYLTSPSHSTNAFNYNGHDPKYLPTLLLIQLNINSKTYKAEPDIIHCDSFVEQPGNWINLNH